MTFTNRTRERLEERDVEVLPYQSRPIQWSEFAGVEEKERRWPWGRIDDSLKQHVEDYVARDRLGADFSFEEPQLTWKELSYVHEVVQDPNTGAIQYRRRTTLVPVLDDPEAPEFPSPGFDDFIPVLPPPEGASGGGSSLESVTSEPEPDPDPDDDYEDTP